MNIHQKIIEEIEHLREIKTIRTAAAVRFARKAAKTGTDHEDVAQKFYDIGATPLGSGLRASVIEKPETQNKEASAIKLYSTDTAYDTYISHTRTDTKNPHHPRIFSRGTIPDSDLNFVHMEKLQPLAPNHPIRKHLGFGLIGTPQVILDRLNSGEFDSLKTEYPQFHETLNKLARRVVGDGSFVPREQFDIHFGNIMQRKDGTPVITDPMVSFKDKKDIRPPTDNLPDRGGTETLKRILRRPRPSIQQDSGAMDVLNKLGNGSQPSSWSADSYGSFMSQHSSNPQTSHRQLSLFRTTVPRTDPMANFRTTVPMTKKSTLDEEAPVNRKSTRKMNIHQKIIEEIEHLRELKTLGTSPLARFVRKIAPRGPIRYIASQLEKIGGNKLGTGARATVFDHPTKKDVVIKLYPKDTAYDSFLENVKADQENPHLPKILHRGKFDTSKSGKPLHFVAMEKLQPIGQDHPILDHIGGIYGIHGPVHEIKDKMEQGLYDSLRDHYPDFHRAFSSLVNKHLKDENPPTIDLHRGNIMQRKDGTPVITDPMVDWNDDDNQNLRVGQSQEFSDPMNTDQLRKAVEPKVKLTSSDRKLLGQLGSDPGVFKEEAPVNNVGSGNIAGVGVGPKGEPGRNPSLMPMVRRSRDDFAGKAVFSVPPKLYDEARLEKRKYQRWTKYLEENSYDELAPIREYANANPAMPIIIENEKTGAMCYVKYGRK